MADFTLIQSPPNGPQKESKDLFDELAGKRIEEIAAHLSDLSSLLYENQDLFKNHPVILGAENLLSAYSEQLTEIAKTMQAHKNE